MIYNHHIKYSAIILASFPFVKMIKILLWEIISNILSDNYVYKTSFSFLSLFSIPFPRGVSWHPLLQEDNIHNWDLTAIVQPRMREIRSSIHYVVPVASQVLRQSSGKSVRGTSTVSEVIEPLRSLARSSKWPLYLERWRSTSTAGPSSSSVTRRGSNASPVTMRSRWDGGFRTRALFPLTPGVVPQVSLADDAHVSTSRRRVS